MLTHPRTVCILFALALAGATTAQAETVRATAGRPALIDREASWDRNCTPTAYPQVAFVQPPMHGSISSGPTTYTIRHAAAGGAQCIGHVASGEATYYTAQPGFHGVENVRFTTTFPNGVVLSHEKTILVR